MADQVSIEYGTLNNLGQDGLPPKIAKPSVPAMPSVYTNDHAKLGPYDEFMIDSTYETDSGLRVLAKAGSGADATVLNSVIRIHRGTCRKQVRWTAQLFNAKPKIPKWKTGDPNEIPLTQELKFANMAEGGAQGRIYRASGVYTYALLKPKNENSKYPIGTTPAEVAPSAMRWYGPEDFSATIIDAAFAQPSNVTLEIPLRVGS